MTKPNYDINNENTLSGVIAEVLKNYALTLENCLPGIVESYDRQKNTAIIRPAINNILTDGQVKERAAIELPVHIYGGNGIVIAPPLKKGDTGFIIAGDRDITLFKQLLKVANPNTQRTHKLSFGFFMPSKIKGFAVSGDDDLLIETLDGATKITLKSGLIEIISTDKVNVTSPDVKTDCTSLTITAATVDITASGSTTITTPSFVVNSAAMAFGGDGGGNSTFTGNITGTGGDITADGISLKSHTHGGVTAGGDNTGTPN